MSAILKWDNVVHDRWTQSFEEKQNSYLIYELTKLPNFTDHIFGYLSQEIDTRQSEVLRRQITMLNYFHDIAKNGWAVSLRLIKKNERISLYLVFRYSGLKQLSQSEFDDADSRIQNALMNEYSFQRCDEKINEVLDISWASNVSEITKREEEYRGEFIAEGRDFSVMFYVPLAWNQTDNSMESICSALIRHKGRAVVEVTVTPTNYLVDERNWVSMNIRRLKEYQNGYVPKDEKGEILRGRDNKPIAKSEPQPELKTPIDNFEKINKQYQTGRVFLTSIRVWSDKNSEFLASAFTINSVKGTADIHTINALQNAMEFNYMSSCYKNVDISAKIPSKYWMSHDINTLPFRAQRLNRLNSIEEISNFFRIPMPIKSSFPGFGYDTGIAHDEIKTGNKETFFITLGSYNENKFDSSFAKLDIQNLAKHGLIVGVPGSGKTTAMFNILYQLWEQPEYKRIPFIILEPAKTEYRALKTLDIFKNDMLVFTLGDESVSPFRFNPLEVPDGIRLESHISKLQACFTGAFESMDGPLPIYLEKAIRMTYLEKGWYENSIGGEKGPEIPMLSDLYRNAELVTSSLEYGAETKGTIKTALVERLKSLCEGSKGRMLNTKKSIPMEDLMTKPVVLELDSLNGEEKSLVMMFLLSYVYEYCKIKRKSGMPLKHMMLVEEAHNLIGAQISNHVSNAKAKSLELFVNMLAEMRALGEGILIADQLPTAIAPQAVKQTNVKILMRVTAKDDREEIGNSMDLDDIQMHSVINFKTGDAYIYHEGEDRVRTIKMTNFKGKHNVEEPPSDIELYEIMKDYEISHAESYMPFIECQKICEKCNRKTKAQAEEFLKTYMPKDGKDIYDVIYTFAEDFRERKTSAGALWRWLAKKDAIRIIQTYGDIDKKFGGCVYLNLLHASDEKTRLQQESFDSCLEKFLTVEKRAKENQ